MDKRSKLIEFTVWSDGYEETAFDAQGLGQLIKVYQQQLADEAGFKVSWRVAVQKYMAECTNSFQRTTLEAESELLDQKHDDAQPTA